MYRYVHNLQGDIVGIVDSAGNLVVEYRYDAWGKQLVIDGVEVAMLREMNPFGYRGYVYDKELGLFYLRNRYYASENGRFINADRCISRVDIALFRYCKNNPISYFDPSGNSAEDTTKKKKSIFEKLGLAFGKAVAGIVRLVLIDPAKSLTIEAAAGVGLGGSVNVVNANIGLGVTGQVNNSDYIRITWGNIETGNTTAWSAGYTFGSGAHVYGNTKEHQFGAEKCICGPFTSSFDEKMACPANVSTGVQVSDEISFGVGLYAGLGGEASVSFSPSTLLESWVETIDYVLYSDEVF